MRVAAIVALLGMLTPIACDPPAPPPKPGGRVTTSDDSNVTAADYVGPAACADCHPGEHGRWAASLHAAMNARADQPGAVIGDFATSLRYAGGEVRFTREGGAYVMTTARGTQVTRYRVTRTIGRRGLQEYVGVIDAGPAEAGRAASPMAMRRSITATAEVRLPFAWWPRRAGWYPQSSFDPWLASDDAFDAYAPVTEPWAERCPWCHSTYPFALRIARSAGPLQLGHGLEQWFTTAQPTATARLAVEQQTSTGISCESCHLGGRAHVAGLPIHLVPRGASITRVARAPLPPATATFAVERGDPRVVDTTCAQCHSGPSPRFPDGSATRNSSEAIDLAAAPCAGIRCTDCHDPHRGPPGPGTDDTARAIAACVGCHAAFAEPAVVAHHAGGHAAATATCLDCHMPRQTLGLDHMVRTHRISSPTSAAMLAAGAPNACNLCHLDRSLAWTVDALAARWDVHVDIAPGDPDAALGEAWLASPLPALRVLAAAAYARAPALGRARLPAILGNLRDPVPYVRAWTLFAVEDLLGRRISDRELDIRSRPSGPAAIDHLLR